MELAIAIFFWFDFIFSSCRFIYARGFIFPMVKEWPAGDKPVNNKAAAGTAVGKAVAGVGKKVGRGAKKVGLKVAKTIHKTLQKYVSPDRGLERGVKALTSQQKIKDEQARRKKSNH